MAANTYEKAAKEKLTEYLKLAARESDKTDAQIKNDAEQIVDSLMDGAVQQIEDKQQHEADRKRRGGRSI